MSASRSAMAASLGGAGRLTEIRQRIFFVLGALLVYRIGTFIPVPGVNPEVMLKLFDQFSREGNNILGMFNMFSGGALERMSLLALGIMPYISASIIMQLLTVVLPKLEQLKKEGEAGRRKITQYTRRATVVLATFQAIGISIALQSQSIAGESVVPIQGPGFVFTAAVSLVTGTMFLMWLGEQITERGIGNGISMIIFAGIVAGLPAAIGGVLDKFREGDIGAAFVLFLVVLVFAVIAFVVFVERGQRRITVNYAKRQQGRKMYGGTTSHLPLKLNMAGVIPPIFASSIILFPATIGSWVGQKPGLEWIGDLAQTLSPGQPLYIGAYAAAIIFFCFFYTALVFNSKDTAENLKKSGAFIPGIRPGDQTARYVDGVLSRLTMVGALYITAVCLLPEFLILYKQVSFSFGGTSLLIIVVVVMDFMAQLQSHLMSHQYEGMLKKANLKGGGLR